MKQTKKEPKVYTWTCKKCKKVIASLYEGQLEYNKKVHNISCKNETKKTN